MKKIQTLHSTRIQEHRNSQSGSALIIVLLLSFALAALGAALMTTAKSANDVVRSSVNDDRALLLSESAIATAISRYTSGEDPAAGQENAPIKDGSGSYWVTSSQLDANTVSMIATAQVNQATSVLEVVMTNGSSGGSSGTPLFGEFGVFARQWVEWSNNGLIDSYDPAVGYASSSASERSAASMRSNSDIYMTGGTTLQGDAQINGTLTLDNGAQVTGTVVQTTEDYVPPAIPDVPSFPSEGSYFVPYGNRTIAPGDHAYDSMTFNGGSVTTIIGPATIATDSFRLDQGSRVIVDAANGPVEFHVSGTFLVNNGTRFETSDHDPKSLRFYLSAENGTTGEQVAFQGGAILEGFVFAPNSELVVDNGTSIFGAVAANRLLMRGGAKLHQDKSLSTFSIGGDDDSGVVVTGDPEVLMWRSLSTMERDALLASRN